MEKRFLSIREASQFLGISKATLHRLINSNNPPPSYKIGGKRVFDKDELVDWVKSHKGGR